MQTGKELGDHQNSNSLKNRQAGSKRLLVDFVQRNEAQSAV
jgi:hypothetical protein